MNKKTCTGPCGRELPLGRFYPHGKGKDGHRAICIDCELQANARRAAAKRKRLNSFSSWVGGGAV